MDISPDQSDVSPDEPDISPDQPDIVYVGERWGIGWLAYAFLLVVCLAAVAGWWVLLWWGTCNIGLCLEFEGS